MVTTPIIISQPKIKMEKKLKRGRLQEIHYMQQFRMYNKTTLFLQRFTILQSLVSSMGVMMVCIQNPERMCRSLGQDCGAVPLVGNAFP